MTVDEISKLLTSITGFTAVGAAAVAYLEYRIKRNSSATQDDISLATAFTELLARADGRVATMPSEAAISKLFESELMKQQATPGAVRSLLEGAGIIGIGNGDAAQAAAIECVCYFGCQYPMLNVAAREGLARAAQYSKSHAEQAKQAIKKLESASQKS